MKAIRNFTLYTLHFTIVFAAAFSGVAKTFDVDISTGRASASNEAYYHGETIEFRAVRGRTVVTNIEYGCIYYQTNGMGDVWWKTDGLTFHPTNDVGAARYRFFLEGRETVESGGVDSPTISRDWHANGLLRLLPSPGFSPNEIALPVARLDFARLEIANAPWPDEISSLSNSLAQAIAAKADRSEVPTSFAWAAVTGKPTTLAGYGITDAASASGLSSLTDFVGQLDEQVADQWTALEGKADAEKLAALSGGFANLVTRLNDVDGEARTGWELADELYVPAGWLWLYDEGTSDWTAPATLNQIYDAIDAHDADVSAHSQLFNAAWAAIRQRATTNELAAATNATLVAAIEYIDSPQTAATNVYTGTSRDTELRNGKMILYRIGSTPSGNWTLNLTLADESTTGPKPTYISGTTQLAKRYGAGNIIPLVYRADVGDGAWYAVADYNTDANNYDRNIVTYCRAAEALAAGVLVVGTTNGYVKISTNVTFDVNLPVLFINAAQTAGKTNGNNWYSNYTGINLGTTWTGWNGTDATRRRPVFLVGSFNPDDDTFTIDAECPFSLEPRRPCFPLGWYNANADGSFCFLPGPLIEELPPDWTRAATKPSYTAQEVGAAPASVTTRVADIETWAVGDDVALTVHNATETNATFEVSYTNQLMYSSAIQESNTLAKAEATTVAHVAALAEAIDETKANKAWGGYTSGGAPSPADALLVEKKRLSLTGGANYAWIEASVGGYYALAVSLGGGGWTLESLAAEQDPDNPTTVTMRDGEGNAAWQVTSTSSREVACVAGVDMLEPNVAAINGNDVVTMHFPVDSAEHPTMEYLPALGGYTTDDWAEATAANWPAFVASVTWTQSTHLWTATVTMHGQPGQGFFRGKYTQPGTTYTKFDNPIGFSQVVIGGVTYNVAVETVSGKRLMVLTVAN